MMARSEPGGAAPAGSRPDVDVEVAALGYAEASRELDAIVAFFEQRDVDVDQLVAKLERATAIVGELDRRLNHTRMQVEELVPRLEAVAEGRRAPPAFDDEALDDEAFDDEAFDDEVFDDELPLTDGEGLSDHGLDGAPAPAASAEPPLF